ncbi:hypothetical protein F0562_000437 [Nyssa sinensis]|uniref:BHLH domain-containing protein n=1 Tax=Nyssa sinensis TaxID=561372 RepID=A0A5J5C013_9ASTE|nr:hypothetical protein F0562_000437 [Nyssa sinensis]
MDQFFQEEMFLLEAAAPPANRSDFVRYSERPIEGFRMKISNHRNINRRMIEFLRSNRRQVMESKRPEKERCFRHMINERIRREKQKQSYLALHSVLSPGTKSDKNSITQMALKEVPELQRRKEELERRNKEIEAILGEREAEEARRS